MTAFSVGRGVAEVRAAVGLAPVTCEWWEWLLARALLGVAAGCCACAGAGRVPRGRWERGRRGGGEVRALAAEPTFFSLTEVPGASALLATAGRRTSPKLSFQEGRKSTQSKRQRIDYAPVVRADRLNVESIPAERKLRCAGQPVRSRD